MVRPIGPQIFNIPPQQAFADALVAGIIKQHGAQPLSLAHGAVLVPNNRAVQAVRDAFVRRSDQGLLLPRLIPIGDADLEARLGASLDPIDNDPVPPAVEPLHRQLILARIIQLERAQARNPVDAAEAMRLAGDLAQTLDQLIVEEIEPRTLQTLDLTDELAGHWQESLAQLTVVLDQWPEELRRLGCIDLTTRRNRLLHRLAQRWEDMAPSGFIIAAGISTVAPAVANLLRVIARLPRGQVVLAGLDPHLSDDDWNEIGGSKEMSPIETHPQFHLKLLLDRMKIARGEVMPWLHKIDVKAQRHRSLVLHHAMALAEATKRWHTLAKDDVRLHDVAALTCQTPAHEAQTIAIALRQALDTPSQTIALITPDRDLAQRIVALLARWGINADDSAGQSLASTRIGGLILALVEATDSNFAPVPLLTLLKHPLIRVGDARLMWLDGVRALDLALRGPRPASGLAGIAAFLASGDPRTAIVRAAALDAWTTMLPLLLPLERLRCAAPLRLAQVISVLRDVIVKFAGDDAWRGIAGQQASDLLEQLETLGNNGPQNVTLTALPTMLRQLMDTIAVRPEGQIHPRLSIWGLLEAKLQTADIMILGGLNEGVWPALPATDPWLAPRIRRTLGLPTLERRIGLAAHDLVGAMGAKQVLLTRAARDATSPTIASRFWLRLQALTGGLPKPKTDYAALALALDTPPHAPNLSAQPAPLVPLGQRPRVIRITHVDTLRADPFSFYARAILKLGVIDPVDAAPSAAWRGSLVHSALEAWAKHDDYVRDKIVARFEETFAAAQLHPLLSALWLPRFTQAAEFIANKTQHDREEGRIPAGAELPGKLEIADITLIGRLDRIDLLADGTLAIMDYKTGDPPTSKQVAAGYALQLGLIGWMAARGGFQGIAGVPAAFEYWSLSRAKNSRLFGKVSSPLSKGESPAQFLDRTEQLFREAAAKWLTGDAPFTAKLQPEYAYNEFDHLMRYDEWVGRG